MRRKRKRLTRAKFSKIIIVSVLAAVASFTVAMIFVYTKYGGIPDTLVVSFFSFAGGEAGVLGLIKCNDEKQKTKTADSENDEAVG
jgi:hypothetical protein